MLRIGITGGIGSGKSTFCAHLEEQGAVVFDADSEANAVMVGDASTRKAIIDLMGPFAYQVDGLLDREFVSRRIFSDPIARRRIGEIVHPRVQERFLQAAKEATRAGAEAIVREAALLPPAHMRDSLDVLLVVEAPREDRVHRVVERNHLPREAVMDRIDAQPADEVYRSAADEVIVNDGSLDDLRNEALRFWGQIIVRQSA